MVLNPITNQTLSADVVIGEILDLNNVFIPIAVGPFGDSGSLFQRFIEHSHTLPCLHLVQTTGMQLEQQNEPSLIVHPMVSLAKQIRFGVKHGDPKLFEGSYLSQYYPSIWANQLLGLATCTYLVNHINTSLTKISSNCADNTSPVPHSATTSLDDELVGEWKFFDSRHCLR